jgi:heme exporter protein A
MKLIASNISVIRGEELILEDISFTVSSNEALIVRGANGSGKSTLLRAIAGLLPLETGTFSVDDPDNEFGDSTHSQLCHYLGHENAMKPAMTVGENLAFWQEFAGQQHLEIDEAMEMVGLDGLQDVPFSHLSTGQRRRISISRLLISYRPIWLLDEPTAGLDAASEKQFAKLMQIHLEDGGLIIAATHIPLGLENTKELVFGEQE